MAIGEYWSRFRSLSSRVCEGASERQKKLMNEVFSCLAGVGTFTEFDKFERVGTLESSFGGVWDEEDWRDEEE